MVKCAHWSQRALSSVPISHMANQKFLYRQVPGYLASPLFFGLHGLIFCRSEVHKKAG